MTDDHYKIPMDGPGFAANLIELQAGGTMLLIEDGPRFFDWEDIRSWVQGEVFSFLGNLSLEELEEMKREEYL